MPDIKVLVKQPNSNSFREQTGWQSLIGIWEGPELTLAHAPLQAMMVFLAIKHHTTTN